ncbi:MAG: hypothetical protein QFE16_11545 [Pseudomonadota bacterium]|nr:hypothetical protein [Pseudomonadota bacterium]
MLTDTTFPALAEPHNANSSGSEPIQDARSGTDASAYLIIHAESTLPHRRGDHTGRTPLQRLRAALYPGGDPAHRRNEPLALTLADRHGHQLLSIEDADPTLGVALRPGTYHLTATFGDTRRGYTVALPAGARFDLHLRFPLPLGQRPRMPSETRPARSAQ